ncbi:MAG: sigma-70 family RNA polymerase sigma factor [Eubacterium sp.]|nr:sigma-70 family RNA polymerase sigma factor [Eubacterium sp.]
MNKFDVEKITAEYLKPVYGFALKRCANLQDAEDLTQDIMMKLCRALPIRDDIGDIGKYVWTVAHNALSNYYRDGAKNYVGVSIDEISDTLSDGSSDIETDLIMSETAAKLQSEIAYLSKLQRRIVIAYYYENKKQGEIAEELNIPVGTVKWHLFEAKKELKRGLENMRESSELKFNPVKFEICGTNGCVGSKGDNENFFRSSLSQNIAYSVWKEAKTVNEIADDLGVSPVYIEDEAEFLEEYGFLIKKGDKYLCNILIDEMPEEITKLQDEMYEKAAKIFANEVYDELNNSDILDNEANIFGGVSEDFTYHSSPIPKRDRNFFMWALVPYILSLSGEKLADKTVSFEEAATLRPDGGHNICWAVVDHSKSAKPKYFEGLKQLCVPYLVKENELSLWQLDSEWTGKRVTGDYYIHAQRCINLINRQENGGELNEEEIAFLHERGLIKTVLEFPDEYHGCLKAAPLCVWINGKEVKKTLIAIGDRIKEKHFAKFEALKKPYIEAVLKETPKHLYKMQKYGLQWLFFLDGKFILHCLNELVNSGRLRPPTEDEKKSLSTIIISE